LQGCIKLGSAKTNQAAHQLYGARFASCSFSLSSSQSACRQARPDYEDENDDQDDAANPKGEAAIVA
jgi:hypothetical protein